MLSQAAEKPRETLALIRREIDAEERARIARAVAKSAERRAEWSGEWANSEQVRVPCTHPSPLHKAWLVANPSPTWPDGGALARVEQAVADGGITALLGNRGTGKTQWAAWLWARARPNAVYMPLADMLAAVKSWYGLDQAGISRNMRLLETVPILIIDEVKERYSTTEHDAVVLTRLIDRRYGERRGTVLIGNIKPDAFVEQMGSSIASRIQESGGVVECKWPSYRAMGVK